MTCPHCSHAITIEWQDLCAYTDCTGSEISRRSRFIARLNGIDYFKGYFDSVGAGHRNQRSGIVLQWTECPKEGCGKIIVRYCDAIAYAPNQYGFFTQQQLSSDWEYCIPKTTSQDIANRLDERIGDRYCKEYQEALGIFHTSPRMAVVMGRLMVERSLREKLEVKIEENKKIPTMYDLIEQFEKQKKDAPQSIIDQLHGMRRFGNVGAHPNEEDNNIKEDDAILVLDIVRDLLDYLFIRPLKDEEMKKRIAALENR